MPPRVSASLVFLSLVLMATFAFVAPHEDLDVVQYVGLVHAYDVPADEARKRTVAELEHEMAHDRFLWMVGAGDPDGYAYAVAHNTRCFEQQLNWFRGRPLFTRSAWLLHQIGVAPTRALHAISLVATLALALLLFLALPEKRPVTRLVAYLFLAAIFHLHELAATALSDALSAALVVAGTLLVLKWKRPVWGLALLVVSVAARTDNIMYLACVSFWSVWSRDVHQKALRPAVVALVVACTAGFFARMYIERTHYGLAALIHFRRVTLQHFPADVRASLDVATYLRVLRAWAPEIYTCQLAGLAAFVYVVVAGRHRWREPLIGYGLAMAPLAVCRFLLFPDWHFRFFIVPIAFLVLAAVETFVGDRPRTSIDDAALNRERTSKPPA